MIPHDISQYILVVGTVDTKSEALHNLKNTITKQNQNSLIVDISTKLRDLDSDIKNSEIASFHPDGIEAVFSATNRAQAVGAMSKAFKCFMQSLDGIKGVIGIGGSSGSWIVTNGMKGIPIGIPKLLVTTIAASDMKGYLGTSDICVIPSITDIIGDNALLSHVLRRSALMICSAIGENVKYNHHSRPAVGITMFGVTTKCVENIRNLISDEYDLCVFHANGIGSETMERLVEERYFKAILDITTTDVADLICGGVFSAHKDRFRAIANKRIPYVGSVGAISSVNFGPMNTVPELYKGRRLITVTPEVTVMRTNPAENLKIAEFIGDRLNEMKGPVRFLLPERGVSDEDCAGKPSFDQKALDILYRNLEKKVKKSKDRQIIRIPCAINETTFATYAVEELRNLVNSVNIR